MKGQVGPVSYKTPAVLLIRYCTTHALLTPGVSFVRGLSILLQFTDSDYPFDIFKFFIHKIKSSINVNTTSLRDFGERLCEVYSKIVVYMRADKKNIVKLYYQL